MIRSLKCSQETNLCYDVLAIDCNCLFLSYTILLKYNSNPQKFNPNLVKTSSLMVCHWLVCINNQ